MRTKVLIVDDEAGLTRLIQLNLERTGFYEVEIVNESPLAIAAARRCLPDVILLDMQMPDMSGAEILDVLSADPILKDIPVIMLTAALLSDGTDQDGIAFREGRAIIEKPMQVVAITHTIDTVLKRGDSGENLDLRTEFPPWLRMHWQPNIDLPSANSHSNLTKRKSWHLKIDHTELDRSACPISGTTKISTS